MRPALLVAVSSIAAVLLAASAAGAQTAAAPAPRLNVLLIMADDLNDHLGTFGHPAVPTPNLDRLAARGVRFTRAYTQFPLCSPSRVSMLTGLRPDRTRVHDLRTDFRAILPDAVTLPQLFRRHGYVAARVGKIFHYGNPGQIGTSGLDDPASWDAVVNPRGVDKDEEGLLTNLTPGRGLGSALAYYASPAPDEAHTDGKVAAETVALLERHKDRPFFIGAGFYRPHCPFIAPKRYFDAIARDRLVPPASPADPSLSPLAWSTVPAHWGVGAAGQRDVLHAYYASIAFLDANVGRVLDALDRLDLWKHTIVVFVSDHGYQLGEKGQWMKQTLFERSLRTPLVIAAPGLGGRGRSSARIVELLDVYPTVADLAGLAAPPALEGRTLRPLLSDPDAPWDRPAVSQVLRRAGASTSMGYSLRTARWRYTEWNQGESGVELYDVSVDPGEDRNLAAAPAHAATMAALRRQLHAVQDLARLARLPGPAPRLRCAVDHQLEIKGPVAVDEEDAVCRRVARRDVAIVAAGLAHVRARTKAHLGLALRRLDVGAGQEHDPHLVGVSVQGNGEPCGQSEIGAECSPGMVAPERRDLHSRGSFGIEVGPCQRLGRHEHRCARRAGCSGGSSLRRRLRRWRHQDQ